MKRFLLACGLVLLISGPLLLLGRPTPQTSSFTVSESDDTYKLLMTSGPAGHARLIQYLNDHLQPVPALTGEAPARGRVLLGDQTPVLVRISTWEVRLSVEKNAHSAAVERMRQLAPDLKRLTLATND